MKAHTLGLPRIGAKRELKKALEAYWKAEASAHELELAAHRLRLQRLAIQNDAGLDWLTVGDFALYDHFLTHHGRLTSEGSLEEYFARARGQGSRKPWDMTKWFDTNYHYLVPELDSRTRFEGRWDSLFREIEEAVEAGYPIGRIKPVVVGPVTYLALSRYRDVSGDVWSLLDPLVAAYRTLYERLAQLQISWVQVDEPVLALDVRSDLQAAFRRAYAPSKFERPSILLAAYFGEIVHQIDLIDGLDVEGVHLDLVRGGNPWETWKSSWPNGRVVSAGVVDGRNVWKTAQADVDRRLCGWIDAGVDVWIASSCSLVHVPYDLNSENDLDPSLRAKLSFAVQKLDEIRSIADERALTGGVEVAPSASRVEFSSLETSRSLPWSTRSRLQAEEFGLPAWPTTTIGSFPQTADVRQARSKWKKGEIDDREYERFVEDKTAQAIREQEELGLDVLVHGEFERNDMVEYFGELLEGYAFTQHGWVQSYGSRCVKPPVIYGDVKRKAPMTVRWIAYAQSLTSKIVKGMLTGPVTMLQWTFPREDLSKAQIAFQIAAALREEILDLETAGIRTIQVDEAAFREGLPLRTKDHDAYWEWAVGAFRYAVSVAGPKTAIHTHMCYSDFSTCLSQIAGMDADVITIETSRSGMQLLRDFRTFSYPNAIGPGVWDIHSPLVPTVDEIVDLLEKAQEVVPSERLWVNPDCGLKTRGWEETRASLRNLVSAAKILRARRVDSKSVRATSL